MTSKPTLGQVQSFEYVIAANAQTPGLSTLVEDSPAQLIITGGGATDGTVADRSDIDPTGSKLVLGYIDATEADVYAEPSLFAGPSLPSWFGNQNPVYPGLYSVQYWNPAWEPQIISQINTIVAKGYDGVFLDVLSGDNEWQANNIEGNPIYPDATQALITLLNDIKSYVNSLNLTHPFYLIGNNPNQIGLTDPASSPTSMASSMRS